MTVRFGSAETAFAACTARNAVALSSRMCSPAPRGQWSDINHWSNDIFTYKCVLCLCLWTLLPKGLVGWKWWNGTGRELDTLDGERYFTYYLSRFFFIFTSLHTRTEMVYACKCSLCVWSISSKGINNRMLYFFENHFSLVGWIIGEVATSSLVGKGNVNWLLASTRIAIVFRRIISFQISSIYW